MESGSTVKGKCVKALGLLDTVKVDGFLKVESPQTHSRLPNFVL